MNNKLNYLKNKLRKKFKYTTETTTGNSYSGGGFLRLIKEGAEYDNTRIKLKNGKYATVEERVDFKITKYANQFDDKVFINISRYRIQNNKDKLIYTEVIIISKEEFNLIHDIFNEYEENNSSK